MECKPEHIRYAVNWAMDIEKYFKKDVSEEVKNFGYTINYALIYSVITGMFDFHPYIDFHSIADMSSLQLWDHCKLYSKYIEKCGNKWDATGEITHNCPTLWGVPRKLRFFM